MGVSFAYFVAPQAARCVVIMLRLLCFDIQSTRGELGQSKLVTWWPMKGLAAGDTAFILGLSCVCRGEQAGGAHWVITWAHAVHMKVKVWGSITVTP